MNHNHPAFPQHPNSEINTGLTKREYIAIYAMQALMQSADSSLMARFMSVEDCKNLLDTNFYPELTAKAACIYADALLKELETPNAPNC